jgi:hypothetical protein
MKPRSVAWAAVPVAAALVFLAAPAAGQTPASKAKTWTAPRTPDGQADLQGNWTNGTITPFERPAELAGKQFFTEQEVVDYEKSVLQRNNADRRDGGAEADVGRAYNDSWYDRGARVVPTRRTSLVVDPPDGKIPAFTPEGQKKADARAEVRRVHGPADTWEDRSLWERCITRGVPMVPGPYNNNYQIVQTPGHVAILHEMIHDARVIPLDGRPHLPANVRQWMGDSRGHWEGNTLVVDTTNFTDKTNFRGSGENLHLIERFTRTDRDTILYEFTVDDPATFTKPWTVQAPLVKTEDAIFEYACHEGNYAMLGILAGARAEEKAAAAAAKQGAK